jgi:hypothetical protein
VCRNKHYIITPVTQIIQAWHVHALTMKHGILTLTSFLLYGNDGIIYSINHVDQKVVRFVILILIFLPRAVHDHLMSDDTLSFVASHIGVADLMLCAVSLAFKFNDFSLF